MSLVRALIGYASHPDPKTAACNRIALVVASNQPFYPVYLWWLVGGDWWTAFWTFLSTPAFASVPAVARRDAGAGRALLPVAGIANGMLSAKVFGIASGVELFLIPCALIALLAFERRAMAALLTATILAALLHGHYGAPAGVFDPNQYARLRSLNAYSVAALSCMILWSLIRARAASASPESPPSPPSR